MKRSVEIKPPGLVCFFLKILIRKDMKVYVLGDFDEEYLEIAETSGRRKANIWYWRQFICSLPNIIIDTVIWRLEMLRNYLIVALRNVKRQKVIFLINILGLSIALMVCLWIFLFIRDEFSYDRFHEKGDSIYSVVKTDRYFNHMRRYIRVSAGPALKEFFPGIEYSVRFTQYDVIVRRGNRLFQEQCHFVDKDFFQIFSFQLIRGDNEYILDSDRSVVLTENLANKYFGHRNPVGKTLTISLGQKHIDYTVSGVAKDVPSNSFLQFKMLMYIKELNQLYGPDILTNNNWPLVFTFIRLKDGIAPSVIEERLPAFFDQHFAPIVEDRKKSYSWNKEGPTISLWLQNIRNIYFHSQGIEGYGESHLSKSYILGGIGLLILFIACINLTNLSMGCASNRTVEFGTRKILGAGRKSLIRQFRSEAVSIIIVALFIALILGALLLPFFNRLAGKNILLGDCLSVSNLVMLGGLAVLVGMLAGIYPGIMFSRIPPLMFLRKSFNIGGKNLLVRLLIVVQFSISIFLIIATLTLTKQVNYILTKDLGYDREGVVIINTYEKENYKINEKIFDIFETESEALPHIKSVSGCVFPLSSEIGDGKMRYKGKQIIFDFTNVHYNFFKTMGIKFIAGGDFPRKQSKDMESVIVSETFVKACEIENPIGLRLNPGTEIIGVVEDIHFWNLKKKMRPTIIRLDRRYGPRNLLVRIDTSDVGRAVSSLKSIWKKAQPDKPFDYTLEDTLFRGKYTEEKRWSTIISYSTFFAIMISCMGLIGIIALAISRRIKEIGIRKILGASILRICSLLIKEYILLVGISNLIAWPLGYYFMSKWLNGYAYRITMDAGIFLSAGFMILAITTVTIGLQVFRVASVNPVMPLRYE